MGTPRVPESKSDPVGSGEEYTDIPKTGPLMWVMLIAFLIPPALITFLGRFVVPIPHQTLWVVLLGCPFPVILLLLPRSYSLDQRRLQIRGLLYRVRVPLDEIIGIEPMSTLRALVHPGSLYCSDPRRALKLTRRNGRALVISPRDPDRFLRLKEKGVES